MIGFLQEKINLGCKILNYNERINIPLVNWAVNRFRRCENFPMSLNLYQNCETFEDRLNYLWFRIEISIEVVLWNHFGWFINGLLNLKSQEYGGNFLLRPIYYQIDLFFVQVHWLPKKWYNHSKWFTKLCQFTLILTEFFYCFSFANGFLELVVWNAKLVSLWSVWNVRIDDLKVEECKEV